MGTREADASLPILWSVTVTNLPGKQAYVFSFANLKLKAASWVCGSVGACVRLSLFFLNCYKMANNGWILEFKVSMEAS